MIFEDLKEGYDINFNFKQFVKKREQGAEKIVKSAEEKGGVAELTKDHFAVKIPYYKKAYENFDFDKFKEKYEKLCQKLHNNMSKIEKMDQKEFQKLVGEIEVVGEILIQYKKKSS